MMVSFLVVRKVDILARGGTGSVSNVLTLSQNKRKKKVHNMHLLQVGNFWVGCWG